MGNKSTERNTRVSESRGGFALGEGITVPGRGEIGGEVSSDIVKRLLTFFTKKNAMYRIPFEGVTTETTQHIPSFRAPARLRGVVGGGEGLQLSINFCEILDVPYNLKENTIKKYFDLKNKE